MRRELVRYIVEFYKDGERAFGFDIVKTKQGSEKFKKITPEMLFEYGEAMRREACFDSFRVFEVYEVKKGE